MVILLVGASGLLGTALRDSLSGREIRQLVRRAPTASDVVETIQWDALTPPDPKIFDGVSTVINLGGTGVGDRRWSTARLREIETSRTGPTHALATALSHVPHPIRYLQASAVGYYGDTGNTPTGEEGSLGSTVLAEICHKWEAAAAPAVADGHPTTFLRTGIVLSPNGGALGPLLKLVKLGLAGPMGSGRQWWPWIHVDDWVRAVLFLIENDTIGPVNLTAPEPTSNGEVTREIARAFRRPAFLKVPKFALQLVLGGFADEILRDQHVIPTALINSDFEFRYPAIEEAAHALT